MTKPPSALFGPVMQIRVAGQVVTTQTLIKLARDSGRRPSEILGITDPIKALDFDLTVLLGFERLPPLIARI